MEWTTTDWPDWKDDSRRVEVELEDGRTVQGELVIADFFADGEGDEIPIFEVRTDDGVEHGFAANKRWRFMIKTETTGGTTPATGESDLSLSYTPVSVQPKADDEVTKELLADILLDMVTQHCHQEPSGAYDSGFLGVNADAMRALIELGKMRKVHDGGGKHVQASIGGIVVDNDLQS